MHVAVRVLHSSAFIVSLQTLRISVTIDSTYLQARFMWNLYNYGKYRKSIVYNDFITFPHASDGTTCQITINFVLECHLVYYIATIW